MSGWFWRLPLLGDQSDGLNPRTAVPGQLFSPVGSFCMTRTAYVPIGAVPTLNKLRAVAKDDRFRSPMQPILTSCVLRRRAQWRVALGNTTARHKVPVAAVLPPLQNLIGFACVGFTVCPNLAVTMYSRAEVRLKYSEPVRPVYHQLVYIQGSLH